MIISAYNMATVTGDLYWNYVTLLLKNVNIDGATNNTFRDDGPYNFLPTRNGDVTQGSFSPFGPLSGDAPPQIGGSVWFDGSGDYLALPSSSAYGFGSGDFTMECWFYKTKTGGIDILIDTRVGAGGNANGLALYTDSGVLGASNTAGVLYSGTLMVNAWNHCALVRSGSTLSLYLNGVRTTSVSWSTAQASSCAPYIGGTADSLYATGFISNVRLVKGTALYTGNSYTPPTAPLTAISGTSLLTCQSATAITDASSNAFTVTKYGDARAVSDSPFGYGSVYMDHANDYLSIPTSSVAFGTSDFTIEGWFYGNSTTGLRSLFGFGDITNTSTGILFRSDYLWLGTNAVNHADAWFPLRTWFHAAVSRSSGTTRVFINGVQVYSVADSTNYSAANAYIGTSVHAASTEGWDGYISNFRVVKGSAVYTGSSFTPPTAPLTAISGTSLLTCQDKGSIVDASTNSFTVSRVGDAKPVGMTPFAQKQAGYWSAYFDGSGDYLTLTDSTAFAFGTGDFCVEMFIAPAMSGTLMLYDGRPTNTNGTQPIFFLSNSQLVFQWSPGQNIASTATVPLGKWSHVALTRSGSTVRIFLDGVQVATTTNTTSLTNGTSRPMIGGDGASNSGNYSGYISNVRVVKGNAVYTSAFTPPTAPLPDVAGTSLLTCQDNRFKDNSSNNATLTKTGDVAVSRLNPFGPSLPAPTVNVASAGSVYFDGSGDYLTVPSASNAVAYGTGDFTVEFWATTNSYGNLFVSGYNGSAVAGINIGTTNSTSLWWLLGTGSAWVFERRPTYSLNLGSWNHFAVTRESGTCKLWVNGTLVDSVADTTNIPASNWYIGSSAAAGYYTQGNISNVRVVKGTAVYTAPFTPSTSPLTAISGTSLLTANDAVNVVDASGNNVTISKVGDAKAVEATPFKRVTTAYRGSAYLDGNGDYLSIPGGAPFSFPGDFTIEFWMYQITSSAYACMFSTVAAYTSYGLRVTTTGYGDSLMFSRDGPNAVIPSGAESAAPKFANNVWNHVAVVRSGSTATLYLNGVSTGSASFTNSTTSDEVRIGQVSNSYYWNGYLANLRVVKGVALYNGNFVPPAAPVEPVGGTSLLLNFDNAGIYDGSANVNMQSVGDSKTSTAVTNFSTGASTYFDGNGDWLTIPDNPGLRFGTGSFTVDFWWYPTSLTSYRTVLGKGYNSSGDFMLQTGSGDGKIAVWLSGSNVLSSSVAVTANQWNHVAVVRNGTAMAIYINGTSAGTATNSTDINSTKKFQIGDSFDGATSNYPTVGYMQDVRFTKGIARYTSNFTPPALEAATRKA